MRNRVLVRAIALAALLAVPSFGRQPSATTPSPKHEFRGTWIATVLNLDWPTRGASSASQKAALERMFDRLHRAGINAVFFQVRSESDAMYDSPFEPWSHWLTGQQGTAPDPFYDPLAFAVELAHARGMELHAWINPFRAQRQTDPGSFGYYAPHPSHVVVDKPEWILTVGTIRILNPGLPEVRDYISSVVTDVVRRYDVDGIHFDDYFYPYPPNQIGSQDSDTFNAHSGGIVNLGDWRRDNVNRFVAQVADSIRATKPHVEFGISPFGIWKNGVPSGITGLDAYNVIYADPLAWIDSETVDYIVPQLYWPFGGGQDYGRLAPWWASVTWFRHLYIGHGLYRADAATFAGTLYAASEVPRQVRFNREEPGILGSAFFRAKNITDHTSKGFADTLANDLHARPALTPPMEWKDMTPPAPPSELAYEWNGDGSLTLSWRPTADNGSGSWRRFAVYRTNAFTAPDGPAIVAQEGTLVGVTSDTLFVDTPFVADQPYWYVVTSVSRNSIDSAPTEAVSVEGQAVAVETDLPPVTAGLRYNYPNPFSSSTSLVFDISDPQTVSITVYDALGREVTRLVSSEWRSSGTHTLAWDGKDATGRRAPSGAYLVVLDGLDGRSTRTVLLVR